MGHIPTKLHQFPTNSFKIFCGETDSKTDASKSIPARSITGAQVETTQVVKNVQTAAREQVGDYKQSATQRIDRQCYITLVKKPSPHIRHITISEFLNSLPPRSEDDPTYT